MTKEKRKVHVSITLKEPIQLACPFKFDRPFPQCEPDEIVVSDAKIDIRYKRKGATLASTIFNRTRINYLQSIALGLSQLEGNEDKTLAFSSAICSIDEKEPTLVELPDCLINLELRCSGRSFPYAVIERSLDHDDLAKCLRIMISYYWASSRSFSQEERLKLVWGSFNALYRFWYRIEGHNDSNETDMLDCANELFIRETIFVRALSRFGSEIGTQYKGFVRWKRLTGSRCRSIYIHGGEQKRVIEKKRERLRMLDRETLVYMRDCGCSAVPGKQELKKEIDRAVKEVTIGNSPSRRIAMLLCRYIYIFRCSAVHAEVEYPVFDREKEKEKEMMANLLEAAVVDFSDYLVRSE